jgi:hypothetical protein
MVFASAAQGLYGGPVVGYGSTYYLCASLFLQTKQTLPSFPSPTAISCSDSWWRWVTAINFILIPKVLSDVTTTDANSKGCEWYHKIKSVYALAYHLFVELYTKIGLLCASVEGNKYCDCHTDFIDPGD